MPDLIVSFPAPPVLPAHPKMTLVSETGLTVVVPFAPLDLTRDGMAGSWDTIPRPLRTSVVARGGLPLRA